jgi:hypothetical protein
MYESPSCMVHGCCKQSTGAQWLTTPAPNWTVGWTVCQTHHWLLDAGEEFAPRTAQWPSTERWLLMGDDLVVTRHTQSIMA